MCGLEIHDEGQPWWEKRGAVQAGSQHCLCPLVQVGASTPTPAPLAINVRGGAYALVCSPQVPAWDLTSVSLLMGLPLGTGQEESLPCYLLSE